MENAYNELSIVLSVCATTMKPTLIFPWAKATIKDFSRRYRESTKHNVTKHKVSFCPSSLQLTRTLIPRQALYENMRAMKRKLSQAFKPWDMTRSFWPVRKFRRPVAYAQQAGDSAPNDVHNDTAFSETRQENGDPAESTSTGSSYVTAPAGLEPAEQIWADNRVFNGEVEDDYTVRQQSGIVFVCDGGRDCPAIILKYGLSQGMQTALLAWHKLCQHSALMSSEPQQLANWRQRILHKLEELEGLGKSTVQSSADPVDINIVANRRTALLEAMAAIDRQPDISHHKFEELRERYLRDSNLFVLDLYDVFARARLLQPWGNDDVKLEAAFDLSLLEGSADNGRHHSAEAVGIAATNITDPSEVASSHGIGPRSQITPETADEALRHMMTDWNRLQRLTAEHARQAHQIHELQNIVDNRVVRLEAAGVDCATGRDSLHLETIIQDLFRFRRERDELHGVLRPRGQHDETAPNDDQQARDLSPRQQAQLEESRRQYERLRAELEDIGVSCTEIEVDNDKQEKIDTLYATMLREHYLYQEYQRRISENAYKQKDYARRGAPDIVDDLKQQLPELHESLAEYGAKYDQARKDLDDLGFIAPPEAALPKHGRAEASGAGSAASQVGEADANNSPEQNAKRIELMPGLVKIPMEPQFDRWRYKLGPYAEETADGGELDQREIAEVDIDDWKAVSVNEGDSISIRQPQGSMKTDQKKLDEWEAITEMARAKLKQSVADLDAEA